MTMPEGGWPLLAARLTADGGLLVLLGSLLFAAWTAPALLPPRLAGRQLALAGAAACLGALAWLVLEARDYSESESALAALIWLPEMLRGTRFGALIGLRITCALLATLLGRAGRPRLGLLAGLAATLAQAAQGHAVAMGGAPAWQLLATPLHLLAAAAWFGQLPSLAWAVMHGPTRQAAQAAWRFGRIALLSAWLLLASALLQSWVLIGSLPALIGTAYGQVALGKSAIFALLVGLGWLNRHRLVPHFDQPTSRARLLASLLAQTALALAALLAAGWLAGLPPALHDAPLWPLSWRPSLDALTDPDLGPEAVGGLLGLTAGSLLLLLAATTRRWPPLLAALAALTLAAPHLDLLSEAATPTGFQTSPTAFATTAIMAGAALYPSHCASCHGADGRGHGPAGDPDTPPADLTAAHLWPHPDGDLFWWITHGIAAPDGHQAMPAAALVDEQVWALIDYLHANNAGQAWAESRIWPVPLRAPAFAAACDDGRVFPPGALRGHLVRLRLGPVPPRAPLPTDGIDIALTPRGPGCIAADSQTAPAFALLLGRALEQATGATFLIDEAGWLRAAKLPGPHDIADSPEALAAELRRIRSAPLAALPGHRH